MTAMEIHMRILELEMEIRVLRGLCNEVSAGVGKSPRQLVLERVIQRLNEEREHCVHKLTSIKIEMENAG